MSEPHTDDQLNLLRFECEIDESASLEDEVEERRSSQLSELPPGEWEDIFGDAA